METRPKFSVGPHRTTHRRTATYCPRGTGDAAICGYTRTDEPAVVGHSPPPTTPHQPPHTTLLLPQTLGETSSKLLRHSPHSAHGHCRTMSWGIAGRSRVGVE